ncbi:MAG: DUF4403 family protein, partial [Gemmatimonadaceae bacterium]
SSPRIRMPVRRAFVGVLLCAGSACTREPAPSNVAPAAADAPIPAPPAASRFAVPIEYDITAVIKTVDQVVPKTFGSLDSVKQVGDDKNRHYAFEAKRGPFTAFASGRLLHLRTTLSYSARGYFKPRIGPTIGVGCGNDKERPRIVVELATPLSLGPDWHLVSKARVVSVEPASAEQKDHCDVSIFHKDVTASVVGAAREGITGQLRSIDRKVGSVDLTGKVNGWWKLLGTPIKLTTGVWLLLGPERLSLGNVRGQSKILVVPVNLAARPRIVTGLTEPVEPVRTLPPLGNDTTAEGFRISMDGVIDYGTASRQLTAVLSQKDFTQAGHTFKVVRAAVSPMADGKLGLSLSFTGDARGLLELTGTPVLFKSELAVPDLDYDLRTGSKVLSTFSWLKSEDLKKELRNRAHIPVTAALDRGRDLLLQGLNRKLGDDVLLTGTVDSVAVKQLFVTRDGLVVRAEATGRAGMAVKQR